MRTRLVALALAVAAALPTTPAHADPAQEVIDLVQDLREEADSWCGFDLCIPPDTGLNCPILASLSPGVPGVVDIDSDGDVVVNGWGIYSCPPYDELPPPPPDPVPIVDDMLDELCAGTNCDLMYRLRTEILEPILCPILASLAPGVPPVVVRPDGDIEVHGELVHDCPPYEWWG